MLKKFFELIRFKFHRKDDYLIDIPEKPIWWVDLDEMIYQGLEVDPFTGEPFNFEVTNDMIWNPMSGELLTPEEINYLLTMDEEMDEEIII